jgi:hypothetical protein
MTQLRVCWCGVLSLTRERVCRLKLLLVLASADVLGSESRGTRDHILLSQFRDSPKLEGQFTVFISPRNRVAQLYPQALGSIFVASYDSQGYSGSIDPASTRIILVFFFIVSARATQHRKHSLTVLLAACIARCQATAAARTIENTAPVLLAACVLRVLPSNGSMRHNIYL